jgi:uncharacterized protein (DUF2141 family)
MKMKTRQARLHLGSTKGSTEAILVTLILSVSLPLTAQSGVANLTVRVTGARNSKGRIALALFQSEAGFPGDSSKAIRRQQVEIDAQTRSVQFVLEGIPYGVYAVSVFHDENMNGKLDKNLVGAPKEGYGASNNPRKRMGPPPFDEAKFSVNQPEQSIEIKLIY